MRSQGARVVAISSLTLFGLCWLSGCGLFGQERAVFASTKDDYLDAKTAPVALVVPEDLDPSAVRDSWPIPDIQLRPMQKVFPEKAASGAARTTTPYASRNLANGGGSWWEKPRIRSGR